MTSAPQAPPPPLARFFRQRGLDFACRRFAAALVLATAHPLSACKWTRVPAAIHRPHRCRWPLSGKRRVRPNPLSGRTFPTRQGHSLSPERVCRASGGVINGLPTPWCELIARKIAPPPRGRGRAWLLSRVLAVGFFCCRRQGNLACVTGV